MISPAHVFRDNSVCDSFSLGEFHSLYYHPSPLPFCSTRTIKIGFLLSTAPLRKSPLTADHTPQLPVTTLFKFQQLASKIMKRRRHQQNEREIEDNKDMLSNLPDCILLHIMSFLKVRDAVQTCLLSIRWKHLWRHLPTLTLSFRHFRNSKYFTEFVTQFLSLRDASTALSSLDFEPILSGKKPHLLKRVASYAASHNVNRLRLRLSFGIHHIPRSLFSCRSLTSLDIEFAAFNSGVFPNSLNMPTLTYLKLRYLSFCCGNDGCVEPFSTFKMLNTLILYSCKVRNARQTLCISSTTLLNLSIHSGYYYGKGYLKIELSAPNLRTFDFTGKPSLKFSGSSLSSIRQLSIGISHNKFSVKISLWLLRWLIEMTDIKSLTVTPSTLKALSLVPNILKLKLPSLCNLRSLKLNLISNSYRFSEMCWRDIKLELAGGKSWKENAKLRETIKAGLKPSSFIPDRMIDFLLQNSPLAKLDICLAVRYF